MVELSDDVRNEIIEEIKAGRKIGAIKLYREATGEGLAEAKRFIEEITEKLAAEMPDQFAASKKSGCMVVLAVFIVWVVTTGLV